MNQKNIDALKTFLTEQGFSYEQDVKLHDFSYFRSGGIAKLVVYPANEQQLTDFVRFMHEQASEYKVIGDTSNLLFQDDHNYGVLLSMKSFAGVRFYERAEMIEVQAGAGLPELARKALLWGVTGFEGLEGIPGTVGGGVLMNAGAYDSEIKDCLKTVRGILSNGDSFEFSKDELEFSNRDSLIRRELGKYIITSATFDAKQGDPQRIFEMMELYHAKRHKHQDFLYPTLGSLFSTRDIYSALGVADKRYQVRLKWIRRLFYSKKIRRETPINRRRLNQFVCNYFGWTFDLQPFSDKTMNCITNRGQHTDRFVEYIELLKAHLPDSVRLENEIMNVCLFDGES